MEDATNALHSIKTWAAIVGSKVKKRYGLKGVYMNDKKFREKQQELQQYENSVYSEFLEFIKPYNKKLAEQGCEIFCCLLWLYGEKGKFRMERERQTFNKRESYACNLILQFQPIGENFYECEDGDGLQISRTIASYELNFFLGWKFSKYKTDKLKKCLDESFLEVLTLGLEKVSKKYRG